MITWPYTQSTGFTVSGNPRIYSLPAWAKRWQKEANYDWNSRFQWRKIPFIGFGVRLNRGLGRFRWIVSIELPTLVVLVQFTENKWK